MTAGLDERGGRERQSVTKYDFDLFVIGGGSGGVRAARIAAGYGAKVAIAEEFRLGGTCVIRGCVPKKLFVYASRFQDEFEDAAGFGWSVTEPTFDWNTLRDNKDREILRLEGLYRAGLERAGVEIFAARAELEGPHTVRIFGRETHVSARIILMATGGSPNMDPKLPGSQWGITSNDAFNLAKLPERIAIAGSGYIGVEFAGIFAGLGVDTTLVYRGNLPLRGFDNDLRAGLAAAYAKRGIRMLNEKTFWEIEKTPEGLVGHLSDGSMIEADQIMFALGRSPHTAGLGLKKAGVKIDAMGAVVVNEDSQSSVPSVFSTPEIGTVGHSEADAIAQGYALDIYKTSFRPLKATLSGRDERIIMKLVVDQKSQRVLGVHVLGPDAGEIAQMAAIAVRLGATKADFDATTALHPTAAEELVTMREKWVAPIAAE
jgi:glutathione reductase (NADPH)